MCELGAVLAGRLKLRAAELLFDEALSGRCRVLGRAHSDTQDACTMLSVVLFAQEKKRDAEDIGPIQGTQVNVHRIRTLQLLPIALVLHHCFHVSLGDSLRVHGSDKVLS